MEGGSHGVFESIILNSAWRD